MVLTWCALGIGISVLKLSLTFVSFTSKVQMVCTGNRNPGFDTFSFFCLLYLQSANHPHMVCNGDGNPGFDTFIYFCLLYFQSANGSHTVCKGDGFDSFS